MIYGTNNQQPKPEHSRATCPRCIAMYPPQSYDADRDLRVDMAKSMRATHKTSTIAKTLGVSVRTVDRYFRA